MHVQFRCTGKEVCAFCAQEHPSRECKEPRGKGKDAKYRNCKGPNGAFYRSCPKHLGRVAKKLKENRARRVQEAAVRPGLQIESGLVQRRR